MTTVQAGERPHMRVLCVIPAMDLGGAQRAMAMLLERLCRARHDVALLTWEHPDARPFFPIPPQVAVQKADLLGGRGAQRLFRVLRRHPVVWRKVKKWRPDVVISFIDTTNATVGLSCLGTGVPVIVSERSDPRHHRIGYLKSLLRLFSYHFATRVVVQTAQVRGVFPRRIQDRCDVIPNGVPVPESFASPSTPGADGRCRIIALGRLSPEKRFDVLIEAFGELAPRHPSWDLVIFGDGSERRRLEALRDALGLSKRVALPGTTSQTHRELVASHVFACPSRYEGFPNALAEGLSVGLPAVGTAGVSGIDDLILDSRTGLQFPLDGGASALVEALERLMSDDEARERLGEAARRHLAKWSEDDVMEEWLSLIEEVLRVSRAGAIDAGLARPRHS